MTTEPSNRNLPKTSPVLGRTADTTRIITNTQDPKRCCVKRSGGKERLCTERARGASERQTDTDRRQHSGAFSFQNLEFPGRSQKEGDRRPTVPLNRPHPRLSASSEPPCPTTSSSWKVPLGSAPRMPNSISQGACP